MDRALNDSTLTQSGQIYQYLIALHDCFNLEEGDSLLIEAIGDISVISSTHKNTFQKEVKHHFGETTLGDRNIDFWKTLANWYTEYDRIKNFSHLILHTTAKFPKNSRLSKWNELNENEKLSVLYEIGDEIKENEDGFRKQFNRIFQNHCNEDRVLHILKRFTIESVKRDITGISVEFIKYISNIPADNRDHYIYAVLGRIMESVKIPPHKWVVTRELFHAILQDEAPSYVNPREIPLPTLYANESVPTKISETLQIKKFVSAIRDINYEKQIPEAMNDYWKTNMTVVQYFQNNPKHLTSINLYTDDLGNRMKYTKYNSELEAENATEEEKIKISKRLYNSIMSWSANDFGTIICNQGFFQRGIIHSIVDEGDFFWKVGVSDDEY